MIRWLIASLLLTTAGCLPGGMRIVDGGRVDRDDWPVRKVDANPYRCPLGTELIDDVAESGRRVVTCKRPMNPVPRGFQLVWNDGGRLVSRLLVSPDGMPIERTQWFDNGRKAGEETYVDGRLVRQVAWYENGKTRADLAYDADKDLMLIERFQADGDIDAAGQSREGKRVGVWREWREGALEEVEYIDGLEQGKVVRSYPTGGVEHGQYEAGQRTGTWTRFDAKSNPVREVTWVRDRKTGTYRTYHPHKQVREEGTLHNGRKHGTWRTWFPSGEMESEQTYACDVLWGPAKTYYPTGKLHTEGTFEMGRKVGEWTVYSESGIETQIDTHTPPSSTAESKPPSDCPDPQ